MLACQAPAKLGWKRLRSSAKYIYSK